MRTMRNIFDNFKVVKNVFIKNKIAWILFIISILIFGYSIFIIIELSPKSEYDKRFFGTMEDITINGKLVGKYNYLGEYRSKGVISVNKEIQLNITEAQYYLEKEPFKDAGISLTWPDNITAEFCPDNVRVSGDINWQKNYCINVKLEKSFEDTSSIDYSIKRNDTFMKNIEFLSSGLKGLRIGVKGIPIESIHKEDIFEIEPYSTDLQIQLQKIGYVLSLLGLTVILFQIYEFGIKHLKK